MRLFFLLLIIIAVVPATIARTTNYTLACERGKCKRQCPRQPQSTKQCERMKSRKDDCLKAIHEECDRCVSKCMYPHCRKDCLKNIGSAICAAEKRPDYAPLPGEESCAQNILRSVIACDMECYMEFLLNPSCTSLCRGLGDIVKDTCKLLDLPDIVRQKYRDYWVRDCHPTCLERFPTNA